MTFTRTLIIASVLAWSPILVRAEGTDFNDWTFQTSGQGKDKVCFAATVAKDTDDSAGSRSDSVLYISAWPKDGIKSELSIKLGFDANRKPPNNTSAPAMMNTTGPPLLSIHNMMRENE